MKLAKIFSSSSVDICSHASITFTDPLLQHSPQFICSVPSNTFFGNATIKISPTSNKLPLDIQKISNEFSSAKTIEV